MTQCGTQENMLWQLPNVVTRDLNNAKKLRLKIASRWVSQTFAPTRLYERERRKTIILCISLICTCKCKTIFL